MSGAKVTLQLVGGERYGCPAIGEDTILKGGKVTVDATVADQLLEDSWFDTSNNEHKYWVEADPDEVAEAGDPDSAPAADGEAKAKAASRTRSKSAT